MSSVVSSRAPCPCPPPRDPSGSDVEGPAQAGRRHTATAPPFAYFGGKTLLAERIATTNGDASTGGRADRTEVLWSNRPLGAQSSLFDAGADAAGVEARP